MEEVKKSRKVNKGEIAGIICATDELARSF